MGLRNAGNQRKKEKTHPQAGNEKVKALLNSAGHKIRPSRDHSSHGQVAGLHDCTGTEWLCTFFCKPQQSFVNPVTGVHTQNIERAWSAYKSKVWRLRGNRTERTLKSHLSFIEWTHWFANNHKDAPIGRLLHGIHHLFNWRGWSSLPCGHLP